METNVESQDTGHSLELLKQVVINHWEDLVKKIVSPSKEESSIILRDHVPEVIEQLISILVKGKIDDVELGKAHGFQRAIMTRYSLEDLMTEYSLLRETLIDYLYPMGGKDGAKLIHKYLDIILKHAVTEFLINHTFKMSFTDPKLGTETKDLNDNPVIPTH